MRVPLGNFGNRSPAPVQRGAADVSGLDTAAAAGQRLAQTGLNVSLSYVDQKLLEKEAEEKKHALLEQRIHKSLDAQHAAHLKQQQSISLAQSRNAVLRHKMQMEQINKTIRDQVDTGELAPEQVQRVFSDAVSKLEIPTFDNLPPERQIDYKTDIEKIDWKGNQEQQKTIDHANKVGLKNQMVENIGFMGELAASGTEDLETIDRYFDGMDEQGVMVYGNTWANVKSAAKAKNWENQAEARFVAAKGNADELQQLASDLADGGKYINRFDQENIIALRSRVNNEMARAANATEQSASKRESSAAKIIEDYEKQISTGVPVELGTLKEWQSTVKGTSAEQRFKAAIVAEQEVQMVMGMPVIEQWAFLNDQRASLASGASVEEQKLIKRLEGAIKENAQKLQDAPLQYLQERTGKPIEYITPEGLLGQEQSLSGTYALRSRVEDLRALEKTHGVPVGQNPLLPEEVDMLHQTLQQMTPKETSAVYAGLYDSINDKRAYLAAMTQLAKGSPVAAVAGVIASKDRPVELKSGTASSRVISETIVAGERVLNPSEGKSTMTMPSDKEFNAEFNDVVGKVFADSPKMRDASFLAFKSYYAGVAAKEGDYSGEANRKRMVEAIDAVVGEVVDFNSRGEIVLPYGMDSVDFYERVSEAWEAEIELGNIPADIKDLQGYTGLKNAGGDYYYITQGGNHLVGADGLPIILNLGYQPISIGG